MNIGPLSIAAGLAAQTSQARHGDVERVQQETTVQERATESAEQAEQAEGIGTTHEEAAAGERDADGRMPWQFHEQKQAASSQADETHNGDASSDSTCHHSKDPHGIAGTHLDLEG
jgi:hypothetical protein